MRSLIIAAAILIAVTGLSAAHAISVAGSADSLTGIIDTAVTEGEVDAVEEEWTRIERTLRLTVHEERLRAVRAAITELRCAITSGEGAEREAELLKTAIEEAISREKPVLRQIF